MLHQSVTSVSDCQEEGLCVYGYLCLPATRLSLSVCMCVRSLKALFGQGFFRPPDSSKVTGVYELTLRQKLDATGQSVLLSLVTYLSALSPLYHHLHMYRHFVFL